jgi:hypothetical protein
MKTMRFLGIGDPDHLDPASAYHVRPGQILRLLTRQLFSYRASADLSDARQAFLPVPDLALDLPTAANGGLSKDRLTYRIRLRRGVLWDTVPPREVTAQDFVRGLKRLAHPTVGASVVGYYTRTILGMGDYCQDYAETFLGGRPSVTSLWGRFPSSTRGTVPGCGGPAATTIAPRTWSSRRSTPSIFRTRPPPRHAALPDAPAVLVPPHSGRSGRRPVGDQRTR